MKLENDDNIRGEITYINGEKIYYLRQCYTKGNIWKSFQPNNRKVHAVSIPIETCMRIRKETNIIIIDVWHNSITHPHEFTRYRTSIQKFIDSQLHHPYQGNQEKEVRLVDMEILDSKDPRVIRILKISNEEKACNLSNWGLEV